jgi:chromosome segregation ATPase
VQAAIENATRELRARVESLEAELKKSQEQISTARKEKSDLTGQLQATSAELEQAKGDLAKKATAESEVRDQLAACPGIVADHPVDRCRRSESCCRASR